MSRIRTVKPELFKHEGLFDAEIETGLPLRLAFIGLFTACDREGRFAWRPRALKTDILPYDEIDISRVLDALVTRGFVVKYTVDGADYGAIPSWHRHQVINNREAKSEHPAPVDPIEVIDASATREPRVIDALQQLPRGKEGKGKEGKGTEGGADAPTEFAFVGRVIRLKATDYAKWSQVYSAIPDMMAELTKADDYYSENPPPDGKWFFPVSRWMAKAHDDARKPKVDPDEAIYRGVH